MSESSGSDFLQLDLASAPDRGRADWLAAEVRRAVADGRIRAGVRLPASRTLAADLGLARGVVVEAYQRLHEQGVVSARTGAGTFVADPAPLTSPSASRAPAPATRAGFRLPVPTDQAAEVDLSPGVPDVGAFPRAAWLRHERAVLDGAGLADLGYGDPRGHPMLRTELSGWLARIRGLHADPDDILVVAGVAQSLALLFQHARRRCATAVAVEDPGSAGARDEVTYWGLRPVAVPVDEHGLRVEALEAAGADLALVTPAHQFPTGVVLGPQQRRALLTWAEEARERLVIEDDYDAEHRYDRRPVAALQPSAPERVAHTGSVSKTLAPGMRLGWLVPPRAMLPELVAAKHASDLGSPAVPQMVLARMIASGDLDRHLRGARERQRRRRDAVVGAVRRHLPQAHVGGIEAGLHLTLTLPEEHGLDDVALAGRIREAGVVVHPLSLHRVVPGAPGLVLGYAAHPPDRLRLAVRRLAAALS